MPLILLLRVCHPGVSLPVRTRWRLLLPRRLIQLGVCLWLTWLARLQQLEKPHPDGSVARRKFGSALKRAANEVRNGTRSCAGTALGPGSAGELPWRHVLLSVLWCEWNSEETTCFC